MKAIICGGRDFTDYAYLFATMEAAVQYGGVNISTVITGGAAGADKLAHKWACETGRSTEIYNANWKEHGRSAGPIRNQRMLDEGKPDLVFAFPGGRGTADMVARARKAGIPVEIIASGEAPRRSR